ncbi:hypothetical protein [Lysinibacillus capsici]
MLQEHLAVEPSEKIEDWYRSWKQISTISQVDAFISYNFKDSA